jgi:uncharacterized NAD(P)/FAD-binding protein YdhS
MTPYRICIVGGGPRTTGLIERISANAPGAALDIDIVEPYEAGAGRVWRQGQSPLMWMNSRAGEVTMFTDDSVRCEGPIRPGPTLADWAQRIAPDLRLAPDLAAEARHVTAETFATRRLCGAYLQWCLRRALAGMPASVRVRTHAARAIGLREAAGGQLIALSTGDSVEADAVVLAQGNIDGIPAPPGSARLAPGYTADLDLTGLRPGQDVLVSGLGLAFIDLMALVTEGRGGRFSRSGDGVLRYLPSGGEPRLWAGSRRGVPYLPKPDPRRFGDQPDRPRFVTAASIRAAIADGTLWQLACKEMAWAYYLELATGHRRVRGDWLDFDRRFAALPWASPAMAALVASRVPDPADRLDLDAVAAPLAGRTFGSVDSLSTWMYGHVLANVRRAHDPRASAWAGIIRALIGIGVELTDLLSDSPELVTADTARRLGALSRLGAFIGSGPPPTRLEQLAALTEAGIVRFLGAGLITGVDTDGPYADSASLPGLRVRGAALVEARLPDDDVIRGGDPLLASMVAAGTGRAEDPDQGRLVVCPSTFRVVSAGGHRHPRRIALGSFATAGRLGAFSRPGMNEAFFRQNDTVARQLLELARRDDAVVTQTANPVRSASIAA